MSRKHHIVFCYGTLQIPEVFQAVTRVRPTAQAAQLQGYKRRRIRGECFPGIVPAEQKVTGGVVYRGLDSTHLVRLDRFEADYYRRCKLSVQTNTGEFVKAWTYVLEARSAFLLDEQDWDIEEFRRRHLARFLNRF